MASRCSSGMPTSSLITSSGSRIEKSSTMSMRPSTRLRSSNSAARRRMNPSRSLMRRGVNTRLTILRCQLCSGGSLAIRNGAPAS